MKRILVSVVTLVLLLVVLLIVLLWPGIVGQAQATCDPAKVIAQAAALKTTGDKDKDVAVLETLQAAIREAVAACKGLQWAGKNAKTIGPFTLEQGLYKVTLTTKGYFIGKLQVMSGDCTPGYLFNLSSGEADEGAEAVITSQGCRAIIATSNISAAWTLAIEKIE